MTGLLFATCRAMVAATEKKSEGAAVARERNRLAVQLELAMERPMIALSIVWLVLVVADLVSSLPRSLNIAITAIWIVFIFDLALRFAIAPDKGRFLRRNWISAISLLVPAFRIARVARLLRFARLARGLRLAKFLSSMNRGMRALRRTFRQRAFAYVVTFTIILIFAGAAAMWVFERPTGTSDFETYGSSLWWTAMLMTTMGSQSWPVTTEGRILCLIMAIYAFAMFGYLTATLASLFIGQDERRERRLRAG